MSNQIFHKEQTVFKEELEPLSRSCGFTHSAFLDVSTIGLYREVREMCEKNTCHAYGKTWWCPPGLGSLEECGKKISRYRWGILVQTVGSLMDPFDYDTMMQTQKDHQAHFEQMRQMLVTAYPHMLPLGAGACSRCATCTYPDQPCRFPDIATGSMEGFGMLVTEVCRKNDLAYYYGPGTIAYTSCFLLA